MNGVLAFAWLEYRALRYYPHNLVLNVISGLVKAGMWFFIARFVAGTADQLVAGYGGSYVAYVVTGVVLYEAGSAALGSPFSSISTAFWEKRLEGYHLAPHGIWQYIIGRFLWQWLYATVLQAVVLVTIVAVAGIGGSLHVHILPAVAIYLLFVAGLFGLGLVGASLFFLLEVKQGKEPVAWLVDYAVRITSGVYIPVSVLPAWLKSVGYVLPHTYALRAMREALLGLGAAAGAGALWPDLAVLALFAVVLVALGVFALNAAIRRAERESGVGVVV